MGFARAGARVGILGRNQAELDVTRMEIEHAGGNSLRLRADVRKYSELQTAVARMASVWGAVEVLIANAGVVGPVGPFVESQPDQWQVQIQALIQLHAEVLVYSDGLTDVQIQQALFTPCRDIVQAVAQRRAQVGAHARVCVMPDGPQTIAYLQPN